MSAEEQKRRHLLHERVHTPLSPDRKPMTGARILRIAGLKGFEVTAHYRNDSLRKHCRKLVKAGWLRRDRHQSRAGGDFYALTPAAVPVCREEGICE